MRGIFLRAATALGGGSRAGRWSLAGAAVIAAGAVTASLVPASQAQVGADQPAAAVNLAAADQGQAGPGGGGAVWLEQGWSREQREWYHHAGQGTSTIPVPYSWFMALEQPDSRGMLSDAAYLDQFGFIPSPRSSEFNPDGLPIGFARTLSKDPETGEPLDQIGFTCGACHTGRLDYRGTQMLVDGGPALTNLGMFRNALAKSLAKAADLRHGNFDRFAKRLYPDAKFGDPRRRALWAKLAGGLVKGLIAKMEIDGRGEGTIEEGFGRLDALNRIGNEVFANQLGKPENLRALTAPVAYPHIWDTSWFDWVQYNSSIEQPMVRNAGEAMGVSAKVNWKGGRQPLYTSTVPVDNLYRIESSLAGAKQPKEDDKFTGLRSPRWPDSILGKIDDRLAARGADLYKEMKCASCHLPAPNTKEFWDGPHWTSADANPGKERYLALQVIPVKTIGTDEAQAADMKARKVRVPMRLAFGPTATRHGGDGVYAFGPALGTAVERVTGRWYDSRNTSPADRARMNGFRPNGIRDGLRQRDGSTVIAYKARPLNGIWATPPFLHNGSIPTLYALLSPYRERPTTFWLGNRQFDPVNVGYATTQVRGGFLLDTSIRGNRNTGHLFDVADGQNKGMGIIGRPLTTEERRALVEYLKTL
jgi:hypothetical protein